MGIIICLSRLFIRRKLPNRPKIWKNGWRIQSLRICKNAGHKQRVGSALWRTNSWAVRCGQKDLRTGKWGWPGVCWRIICGAWPGCAAHKSKSSSWRLSCSAGAKIQKRTSWERCAQKRHDSGVLSRPAQYAILTIIYYITYNIIALAFP